MSVFCSITPIIYRAGGDKSSLKCIHRILSGGNKIVVKNEDDMIVVKSNEGIQKILISSLIFAEVIGRNVLYHLSSGKIIECTESFSGVCDRLMEFGCFIKTHRSYIVNMQYVDIIENTQVTLQNHKTVPVAQGKAKEIKQQYLDYQMEGE